MAPLSLKAPTAEVLSVMEEERITEAEILTSAMAPREVPEAPPPLLNDLSTHVYWACAQTAEAIARIDKAQDALDGK